MENGNRVRPPRSTPVTPMTVDGKEYIVWRESKSLERQSF